MPWVTPTLDTLRSLSRDNVTAKLRSGPMIPNSVERVMADSNAGLAYLTLLYLNWLALQIMPDTAETDFLRRFGNIWQPGGTGPKVATFASVVANFSGINGTVIPINTLLNAVIGNGVTVLFKTTAAITLGGGLTPANFVALSAGATQLVVNSTLALSVGIAGVNGTAAIVSIVDGINAETDDELRVRVLNRIQQPPVGG